MSIWRFALPVAATTLWTSLTSAAMADPKACAAIVAAADRLACYDRLFGVARAAPAATPNVPEEIDFVDLRTDIRTLQGKTIKVQGFALPAGEMMFFYDRRGSLDGLIVTIDKMPRDSRHRLFGQCNDGCDATLTAKVGSSALGSELEALDVVPD